MAGLIGEFTCKLDGKGRFLLPSNLRSQIDSEANNLFIMNRGFEGCLVLYPMNEWKKEIAKFDKLNLYISKNRKFYRQFHNGATQMLLDGAGRILIPKTLITVASIKKDVILFAYANRIEIWAKDKYDEMMSDSDGFENLAEEVMSELNNKDFKLNDDE